jgi:hypothetical protein
MPSLDPQHAETALTAYLNLLKNKGAATSVITRRKHFLRHLLTALEGDTAPASSNDAYYRRAVDATLVKFPDEQKMEFISMAREFHPFWLGDMKTIARLNAADALSLQHTPVDVSGTLIDMFERLDADPWSRQEQTCLKAYLERLQQGGADDAVVDIRERLLLLLLYVIRRAEQTPFSYRAGVEAMLTLFSKEDTRRVFLDVAREFFYFWNGFHEGESNSAVRAA